MLHVLRIACVLALSAHVAGAAGPEPSILDDAQLLQLLTDGDGRPVKCGTPYLGELQSRGLALPTEDLALAEGDTVYYLTPGGHFRIRYSTVGLAPVDATDADLSGVPDYVELVGSAFERSWTIEIDSLGFGAPDIGTARYEVGLLLRGSSIFGRTLINPAAPGGTVIDIHHDMESFCSSPGDPPDCGVNLLLATVAHEFKHAIQFAEEWELFGFNGIQWIELDATWIEDLVFDDSNDYYRYLQLGRTPFTQPSTSLASAASYMDCTWQHFLGEYYGQDFMNDLSEQIVAAGFPQYGQHAYKSTALARGLDWLELWRAYTGATYLTGTRSAAGMGFTEAAFYPVAYTDSIAALPMATLQMTLNDMAMRFHEVDLAATPVNGRVRIDFEAVGALGHWTLMAVFQRPDDTRVVEITITDGLASFEPGPRLQDYERFAVLVGNSRVPVSVPGAATYRLTLGVDNVPTSATSVGSFKGRFRRGGND